MSARPLTLYVAGKWEDREHVQGLMSALRALGHTISHDWTVITQESAGAARGDLDGVFQADALVMFAPTPQPWAGTWVEVGLALAWGKPVYVFGEAATCIFTLLPEVQRVSYFGELVRLLDSLSARFMP